MGNGGQVSPIAGGGGARPHDITAGDMALMNMLVDLVWEPFFLYLIVGGALVILGLVEGHIVVIVLGVLIALLPPLTFVYYMFSGSGSAIDQRRYGHARQRAAQQHQYDTAHQANAQYPPARHHVAQYPPVQSQPTHHPPSESHPTHYPPSESQPTHYPPSQYQQPVPTSVWWNQWRRTPPPVHHNITHCPECNGRVFAGRAYCPHCSSPIPGAHLGGQPQDDDIWV